MSFTFGGLRRLRQRTAPERLLPTGGPMLLCRWWSLFDIKRIRLWSRRVAPLVAWERIICGSQQQNRKSRDCGDSLQDRCETKSNISSLHVAYFRKPARRNRSSKFTCPCQNAICAPVTLVLRFSVVMRVSFVGRRGCLFGSVLVTVCILPSSKRKRWRLAELLHFEEPMAIVGCSPWLAATVKLPNDCAIPKECLVLALARKAFRNCSSCVLVLLFIRILDTSPSPLHHGTTSSQYQPITTTCCKSTSLKTSNFRFRPYIGLYFWKFPFAFCRVYLYPWWHVWAHQTVLCQAFEQFPIGFGEQHIFVDWDEDDDLDVIKSNLEGRTCPSYSEPCWCKSRAE